MSGEEIVFKTTKHWLSPVTDSWKAILLIIGSLALSYFQPEQADGIVGFVARLMNILATVLMLAGLLLLVYNFFNWRSARYFVTNQRVLGAEGIARKRETDTLLSSISDVRTRQSFVGRRLGYGEIKIFSASGEAGADTFSSVRQSEEFKKRILEQKVASSVPARADVGVLDATQMAANGQTAASAEALSPKATEVLTTLAVLASLRDAETITAQEYETKKAELLARI
jgi:uncharacterized membrane protein YdbT with pleckstrin-like domain